MNCIINTIGISPRTEFSALYLPVLGNLRRKNRYQSSNIYIHILCVYLQHIYSNVRIYLRNYNIFNIFRVRVVKKYKLKDAENIRKPISRRRQVCIGTLYNIHLRFFPQLLPRPYAVFFIHKLYTPGIHRVLYDRIVFEHPVTENILHHSIS